MFANAVSGVHAAAPYPQKVLIYNDLNHVKAGKIVDIGSEWGARVV
jgi:hypothetical protein